MEIASDFKENCESDSNGGAQFHRETENRVQAIIKAHWSGYEKRRTKG